MTRLRQKPCCCAVPSRICCQHKQQPKWGSAGPAPALPEPVAANAIQIEEIATEVDAVVHVLQSGDADDTPIIFVDVLDEASPSLDAPGRTL